MNLLKDNTQFIFVMTSKNTLEDRFVDDFKNTGLVFLAKIGFPEDHITIVSDTSIDELQNRHSLSSNHIFVDSPKFLNYIETIDCDNLIIVTSCHGSYEGIDSKTKIQPFPFVSALNKNPYAKCIVVMFGQCYSGIFDYSKLNCDNKQIVLMGASGMNATASVGFKVSINGKEQIWSGNTAVFYFFEWMTNPRDIDGDNQTTILDLYKYVSMMVLYANDKIEHASYAQWIKNRLELDKKIDQADKTNTKVLQQLQDDIQKSDYDYFLPRQLPWILNPEGAQLMSIEY